MRQGREEERQARIGIVRAMGGASEATDSKIRSPLLTSLQRTAGGHGAGKQLESILNDESVPWVRRMCAATAVEMRMLVPLAAPAVLVYMINYLMSMSTRIFSGHLGTLELAAVSLGNTGIQFFAYGLMVRSFFHSNFCE
ncbi:protein DETOXIFICATION 40-like [Triticum urartu]|uniref:protein DETOXIFICATION 40-like n=1 Tax=Triticum urartu TaxID=4572 RepID=UPI0020443CED|nr:protein DETOXIFICATION 40-like [Triticum urartu]